MIRGVGHVVPESGPTRSGISGRLMSNMVSMVGGKVTDLAGKMTNIAGKMQKIVGGDNKSADDGDLEMGLLMHIDYNNGMYLDNVTSASNFVAATNASNSGHDYLNTVSNRSINDRLGGSIIGGGIAGGMARVGGSVRGMASNTVANMIAKLRRSDDVTTDVALQALCYESTASGPNDIGNGNRNRENIWKSVHGIEAGPRLNRAYGTEAEIRNTGAYGHGDDDGKAYAGRQGVEDVSKSTRGSGFSPASSPGVSPDMTPYNSKDRIGVSSGSTTRSLGYSKNGVDRYRAPAATSGGVCVDVFMHARKKIEMAERQRAHRATAEREKTIKHGPVKLGGAQETPHVQFGGQQETPHGQFSEQQGPPHCHFGPNFVGQQEPPRRNDHDHRQYHLATSASLYGVMQPGRQCSHLWGHQTGSHHLAIHASRARAHPFDDCVGGLFDDCADGFPSTTVIPPPTSKQRPPAGSKVQSQVGLQQQLPLASGVQSQPATGSRAHPKPSTVVDALHSSPTDSAVHSSSDSRGRSKYVSKPTSVTADSKPTFSGKADSPAGSKAGSKSGSRPSSRPPVIRNPITQVEKDHPQNQSKIHEAPQHLLQRKNPKDEILEHGMENVGGKSGISDPFAGDNGGKLNGKTAGINDLFAEDAADTADFIVGKQTDINDLFPDGDDGVGEFQVGTGEFLCGTAAQGGSNHLGDTRVGTTYVGSVYSSSSSVAYSTVDGITHPSVGVASPELTGIVQSSRETPGGEGHVRAEGIESGMPGSGLWKRQQQQGGAEARKQPLNLMAHIQFTAHDVIPTDCGVQPTPAQLTPKGFGDQSNYVALCCERLDQGSGSQVSRSQISYSGRGGVHNDMQHPNLGMQNPSQVAPGVEKFLSGSHIEPVVQSKQEEHFLEKTSSFIPIIQVEKDHPQNQNKTHETPQHLLQRKNPNNEILEHGVKNVGGKSGINDLVAGNIGGKLNGKTADISDLFAEDAADTADFIVGKQTDINDLFPDGDDDVGEFQVGTGEFLFGAAAQGGSNHLGDTRAGRTHVGSVYSSSSGVAYSAVDGSTHPSVGVATSEPDGIVQSSMETLVGEGPAKSEGIESGMAMIGLWQGQQEQGGAEGQKQAISLMAHIQFTAHDVIPTRYGVQPPPAQFTPKGFGDQTSYVALCRQRPGQGFGGHASSSRKVYQGVVGVQNKMKNLNIGMQNPTQVAPGVSKFMVGSHLMPVVQPEHEEHFLEKASTFIRGLLRRSKEEVFTDPNNMI